MKIRFVTADVFTRNRFGGNPVAVIADGRGLSTGQMGKIAMEFNLSETTFVLPPKDPAHTAEVRIFTPRAEIPFAGHPNIGTAFLLATSGESHGRPIGDRLVFEEQAGLVEIDLFRENGEVTGARLAAPQSFDRGEAVPIDVVAAACSLSAGDIEIANHPPCIASCGLPFAFAELKTRAALAAASPRTEVFTEHLPAATVGGLHLYTKSETAGIDFHARVFAPLHGVPEDPATGSANVALIGLLAELHPESNAGLTRIISQGEDMGRASLLTAEAEKRDGQIQTTRIGGDCVRVMEGVIDLG